MHTIIMSLDQYLRLGGKVENLKSAFDKYHNRQGPIRFSHQNPPSVGELDGVDMYIVGDNKVASYWIEVEVDVVLDQKYL